ncbi:MAG: flp pilus-assembly TadE/G-like family protein [Nocardioides sp.]|nr:flp pilus-assembly TadE/G-like family protein [Nocardioides sp.]
MAEVRRSESGSASMLVVSLIGVVLLLGMAAAFMTAGAAAHRRAQSGADLAALAGAVALQRGEDPCVAADRVAAENRARVTRCVVEDEDVVLEVDVESPEFGGHTFAIHGKARAGPG